MNAIWRPQTNIIFELVPSTDLDVDQNDARTREGLTKAYGMKMPATFEAEGTVWADKNSAWFEQHRVPGTHMTFFVVHKLHSGGDPVYGKGGETPPARTFAHEAGHYIGDYAS